MEGAYTRYRVNATAWGRGQSENFENPEKMLSLWCKAFQSTSWPRVKPGPQATFSSRHDSINSRTQSQCAPPTTDTPRSST